MARHVLRVTCKAALYTPDGSKVLLSEYSPGDYGLPGGHIDEGETPDDAMQRELYEELGLQAPPLEHRDFWLHDNGKLILGYVGELPEETVLVIQEEELQNTVWMPVQEIRSQRVVVGSYGDFIMQNQPQIAS